MEKLPNWLSIFLVRTAQILFIATPFVIIYLFSTDPPWFEEFFTKYIIKLATSVGILVLALCIAAMGIWIGKKLGIGSDRDNDFWI